MNNLCIKRIMRLFLVSFATTFLNLYAETYIRVNKKNVLHTFVAFDGPTDEFVRNIFPNWENETFDVFDRVKDQQGIAIDLGAWIGTTAIWLSKNFSHVIAIDADRISLQCLKKNLEASECFNVTVYEKPIADIGKNVIFGPRGNVLNQSISFIKETFDSQYDYSVKAATFKQLIWDTIYSNDQLKTRKISFIKCDIEGGEEDIIEDLLHFAHQHNIKVYLSFHVSWWKKKKITDFANLFQHFKTNCPTSDICAFIQRNPFASLLFEPIPNNQKQIVKKNTAAIVVGYNQYTYVKNMVSQLEKYTSDIIVIDNNSNYKPLLDYYENEFKYTLIKQKANWGHTVYTHSDIQSLVGNLYILTDPDLQFNADLPSDFIEQLVALSLHYGASKVGFALEIDSDDIRTDLLHAGMTIKQWESQFWRQPLSCPINPSLKLYNAEIDTTFCLINKKAVSPLNIRIAGDYTCKHLPWYKNFRELLLPGEFEAYVQNNLSTNWYRDFVK